MSFHQAQQGKCLDPRYSMGKGGRWSRSLSTGCSRCKKGKEWSRLFVVSSPGPVSSPPVTRGQPGESCQHTSAKAHFSTLHFRINTLSHNFLHRTNAYTYFHSLLNTAHFWRRAEPLISLDCGTQQMHIVCVCNCLEQCLCLKPALCISGIAGRNLIALYLRRIYLTLCVLWVWCRGSAEIINNVLKDKMQRGLFLLQWHFLWFPVISFTYNVLVQ